MFLGFIIPSRVHRESLTRSPGHLQGADAGRSGSCRLGCVLLGVGLPSFSCVQFGVECALATRNKAPEKGWDKTQLLASRYSPHIASVSEWTSLHTFVFQAHSRTP